MQTTSVKLYSLEYSEAKNPSGGRPLPRGQHRPAAALPHDPSGPADMAADLLLHARGRLQVRLARGAAHGTCVARSQRTALRDARRGGTARDRTQIGAAGRRRRYAAARFRRASLALLAAVVLFYQAAGTLCEWALAGSFHTAVQDFRIGLPGMLLQIFGGWAFINFIIRK